MHQVFWTSFIEEWSLGEIALVIPHSSHMFDLTVLATKKQLSRGWINFVVLLCRSLCVFFAPNSCIQTYHTFDIIHFHLHVHIQRSAKWQKGWYPRKSSVTLSRPTKRKSFGRLSSLFLLLLGIIRAHLWRSTLNPTGNTIPPPLT